MIDGKEKKKVMVLTESEFLEKLHSPEGKDIFQGMTALILLSSGENFQCDKEEDVIFHKTMAHLIGMGEEELLQEARNLNLVQ